MSAAGHMRAWRATCNSIRQQLAAVALLQAQHQPLSAGHRLSQTQTSHLSTSSPALHRLLELTHWHTGRLQHRCQPDSAPAKVALARQTLQLNVTQQANPHQSMPAALSLLRQLVREIHTTVASHEDSPGVLKARQAPRTLDDMTRRHRRDSVSRGFQVIEVYPNGMTLDQFATPMTATDLKIPSRDASLFSSDNSMADQKPTIMVRNGSILFKSEAIRAVINPQTAYIIKTKPYRNYTSLLTPLVDSIKPPDSEPPTKIPFELIVLESLLYISANYFWNRYKHMKNIMESLLRDVSDGSEPFAAVYNEALIQQLAPLDKTITTLRNGSRDTCEAVRNVLDDEDILEEICLTHHKKIAKEREQLNRLVPKDVQGNPCLISPTTLATCPTSPQQPLATVAQPTSPEAEYESDKEQARRMLESYDRELDSLAGKFEEMREHLDTIRDSWSMKLDSARNHIILLNLKMTLMSLCLMLATLFPSWGGMNINHGLPDEPWVFWSVVVFGSVAGLIAYPIASELYRANWKKRSHMELKKFHSLRSFLVDHLDELDEISDVIKNLKGRMDRREFEHYMKDQMPSSMWKKPSLDFLFRQYDTNKDGFLEGLEVARRQAQEKEWETKNMGHLSKDDLDDLYEDTPPQHHGFPGWWPSEPTLEDHQPGLAPLTTRNQQKQGWLSELWFGPRAALEQRPVGTMIRH